MLKEKQTVLALARFGLIFSLDIINVRLTNEIGFSSRRSKNHFFTGLPGQKNKQVKFGHKQFHKRPNPQK
jgi:hypothetical protein